MRQTVLIAGCGSIGSRRARLLIETPQLREHVAEILLYDRRGGAARDLAEQLHALRAPGEDRLVDVVHSYAEGLMQADTVLVCAHLGAHPDLALDALVLGKRCFIEKPLARFAHLVGNFPEVAARSGAAAMVACNWRFHPLVQAVRPYLEGAVETPLAIGLGIYPRLSEKEGGGWLLDLGSHAFDLLQFLRGPFAEQPLAAAELIPGGASLTLRHASGQISQAGLFYAKRERELEVRILQVGQTPLPLFATDEMYAAELLHFLTAPQPMNGLDEALRTLRAIEAVAAALPAAP